MQMSEEELNRFLDEPRIARFATNGSDGYPHVIATWYTYEDGWLYLFCGRSTPRAAEVQRDGRVCILVDDDHYPYKHVTLQGTAQVDESLTDEYLDKLCVKYLGPHWGAKYDSFMRNMIDPVIIKVKISKIRSWDYLKGGYITKAPKVET